MQLEQSLAQAKPSSPEISKVQRNENSRHDGFRQFERFSYMPKILTGIGESLTACAQLSSTLHLLREVPNWVDSLPALAGGGRDKSANANQARDRDLKSGNANMGTVDPLVMGKGNFEEDGLASTEQRAWQNDAKMFRWEQDWAEHLSVLADRIDGMIEMFRTAVTGFRAEIIQRKHYEEVMCLHFYK